MRVSKVVLILRLVLVGLCVFAIAGLSCAPKPVPVSAPAAFQVTELSIRPPEVNPGEEVIITAKVTNTGGAIGSYTAGLKINDVIEVAHEVDLAGGTSQLLRFRVYEDIPGTYVVMLGELTGNFVVVKPAPSIPVPPTPVPPVPASPAPVPPTPKMRTWTLTDAGATDLLCKSISGSSIHFVPENKAELRKSFIKITPAVGVSEGKLYFDGVPSWIGSWLKSRIGSYTSYSKNKLFLIGLPPWFDPTEEIAPDVTDLPTFESITTEEGKAIIIYVWP